MCCLFRFCGLSNPRGKAIPALRNRTSNPKENEVGKDITVAAEVRTSRGKNEAHRTRRAGQIPAVVYGAYQDPVSVAVNPREINKIIRSTTGYNTIFKLADCGRRNHPGHGGGSAGGSHQGHSAACRSQAHRPDQAHPRHRSGAHRGRSRGREGAGRIARNHHPRHRNRVPAGRDSGEASRWT